MSNVVGLDEGQQDVVVLLALVLVHGGDLVRLADQRVVGTPEKLQQKSVIYYLLLFQRAREIVPAGT